MNYPTAEELEGEFARRGHRGMRYQIIYQGEVLDEFDDPMDALAFAYDHREREGPSGDIYLRLLLVGKYRHHRPRTLRIA